jgi:selenocysteine-specific elongation factor
VVSGLGLDDLMHVIAAQTDHLPEGSGRTRMWIDRSFTMPGAGTIVTGTLLEGPLVVGDHVVLHPGGHIARVRGLQTHERSMDELGPRRRAAVNLAGLDYSKIHRGSMLGLPGHWLDSTRLLVDYRPARYATMPRKGSFHLHAGSGAWSVTLRLLSESLAMVDLPVPLPLAAGDRFILRESGRRVVVAGGRVLDPAPPRASVAVVAGSRLRQAVAVGPDAVAGELLEMRGDEQVATLASHSGGGIAVGAVSIGDRVMSSAAAASLEERLRTARSSHSGANPLRPGLPLTEAAAQLGVSVDTAVAIARRMTDLDVVGGNLLAREAAPSPELDPDWKAARQRLFWQGGLNVPPWRSLGLDRELVHALIRRGALIKVSDDLVCLPEHIDRVKQALGELPASFTVSQFRDRVGVTRKLAVPLLEWCDRQELTVRKGDARSVRPGALPGS